ncbi:MAG: 2-C-methyl-D-erythritol 4-phosphate cytidylyltransferase [Acidimicrobiia bacterium]
MAFARVRHSFREARQPRVVTVVPRRFQPAEWSTPVNALIILAGGSGSRAGRSENKVYAPVNGRPVLWYPLNAAANFGEAVRVVLVIRPQDEHLASALAAEFPHLQPRLVHGGQTRSASERAGIEAVVDDVAGEGLVGIHDGARPFLTVGLWQSCAVAAAARGGAVPVLEAGSLYRLEQGAFSPLPTAFKAQTPQVFNAQALLASFRKSVEPAPDTAETVMRHGRLDIAAVPGDGRNIKVTFPADLDRASQLAEVWRAGRWLSPV